MKSVTKVVHVTSAHPRDDVRIFHKMCLSLVSAGYDTTLIVADGNGDDFVGGVRIIDAGASRGRLDRIARAPWRVLAVAKKTGGRLFHLHDPELLPIGWLLKRFGVVVFDSHEDVPKQMLHKPYLTPTLLRFVSWLVAIIERAVARNLDAVIAATPSIREKFEGFCRRVIDINNYPLTSELAGPKQCGTVSFEVCYVGVVNEVRGIVELCEAMGMVQAPVRLNLIGDLPENTDLFRRLSTTRGWERVNRLGYLSRAAVGRVLERSFAGIVVFHPLPNHLAAQPNKMFEYMSAGVPVIASDFPLWRDIIAGTGCGLLVDPLSPASIAAAIDQLAVDPVRVAAMGRAGRTAVLSRYNWDSEERRLLSFYEGLLATAEGRG